MKKTYFAPSVTVVKLEHQSIICESTVDEVNDNVGLKLDGASSKNAGGVIRTRESGSAWDEEW